MSTGTSIGIALPHMGNATSCRQDDQITMIVEDIHLTGLSLGRTPSGLIHSSPQATQRLRSRRQDPVHGAERSPSNWIARMTVWPHTLRAEPVRWLLEFLGAVSDPRGHPGHAKINGRAGCSPLTRV